MSILVQEAESLEEYLRTWKKGMRTVPWFRQRRLFDYNPEEIEEDITKAFQKRANLFLIAKFKGNQEEAVGVLGVTVANNVATLGRWEPAVMLEQNRSRTGQKLLEEAFSRLRQRDVSKIKCMLKFPINQPQTTRWHAELYRTCGFAEKTPSSIMLLADLSNIERKPPKTAGFQITHDHGFSPKGLVDFTQRAYMATPEDRRVHINDPFISDPKTCLNTLQAIRDGKMGFSPQEFWLVAKLNNNIAGFIIGFMPKSSKNRPPHGVIGELGVFPQYRRKGIAMSLISEMLKSFQKLKCRYSLVGTLKTNRSAIALYKKMGFCPVFELVDFEKPLTESRIAQLS